MGAFSVTSSEMTKRTTELRSKNQSLKKQITKLRDSKEALNSTWDGSAKKAFSRESIKGRKIQICQI